jgi:preprotein translocase subunit YajC
LAGSLLAQIGESGAGAAAPGAAGSGAPGAGGGGRPPSNPIFQYLLPLMIVLFLVMLFAGSRTQKKEQRRRDEMVKALKKHDKVQTAAGIIGTVVELKDDQVVLKVDDTTNTRIRFARSAVSQVLSTGRGAGESEPSDADLARA